MLVGHSETSLRRFGKSIEDMIGWRSNANEDKTHKSSVEVSKAVERVDPDGFLEVEI